MSTQMNPETTTTFDYQNILNVNKEKAQGASSNEAVNAIKYFKRQVKDYDQEQTDVVRASLEKKFEALEAKQIFNTEENELGVFDVNIRTLNDDEEVLKGVSSILQEARGYIDDQKNGVKNTFLNPAKSEDDPLAQKIISLASAVMSAQNPDKDPLINSTKVVAGSLVKDVASKYFNDTSADGKELSFMYKMLTAPNDETTLLYALSLVNAQKDFSEVSPEAMKIEDKEDGTISLKTPTESVFGRMLDKIGKNPLGKILAFDAYTKLQKSLHSPLPKKLINELNKQPGLKRMWRRVQDTFIRKADLKMQDKVLKDTIDDISNEAQMIASLSNKYGLNIDGNRLNQIAKEAANSLIDMAKPNNIEDSTKEAFSADGFMSKVNGFALVRSNVDSTLKALSELSERTYSLDMDDANGIIERSMPIATIANAGQKGENIAKYFLERKLNDEATVLDGYLGANGKLANVKQMLDTAISNNGINAIKLSTITTLATSIGANGNLNSYKSYQDANSEYMAKVKDALENNKDSFTMNLGKLGTLEVTNVAANFTLNNGNPQRVTSPASPISAELKYTDSNEQKSYLTVNSAAITTLIQLDAAVESKSSERDEQIKFLNVAAKAMNTTVGSIVSNPSRTLNSNQVKAFVAELRNEGMDLMKINIDANNPDDSLQIESLRDEVLNDAIGDLEQLSGKLETINQNFFERVQSFASKDFQKLSNTGVAAFENSMLDKENNIVLKDDMGKSLINTATFEALKQKSKLELEQLKSTELDNQADVVSHKASLEQLQDRAGNSIIVNPSSISAVFNGVTGQSVSQSSINNIIQKLDSVKNISSVQSFLDSETKMDGLLNIKTYDHINNNALKDAKITLLKAKLLELGSTIAETATNSGNPNASEYNNFARVMDDFGIAANITSGDVTKLSNAGMASEENYKQLVSSIGDLENSFNADGADSARKKNLNAIVNAKSLRQLNQVKDEDLRMDIVDNLIGGLKTFMNATGMTPKAVTNLIAKSEEDGGEVKGPAIFQEFVDAMKSKLTSRKVVQSMA